MTKKAQKYLSITLLLTLLAAGCQAPKPVEPKTNEPQNAAPARPQADDEEDGGGGVPTGSHKPPGQG